MKKNILTGMNGKEVKQLVPENEDDMILLEKMANEGELDANESFGDYVNPDVPMPNPYAPKAGEEVYIPWRERGKFSAKK